MAASYVLHWSPLRIAPFHEGDQPFASWLLSIKLLPSLWLRIHPSWPLKEDPRSSVEQFVITVYVLILNFAKGIS